ncbi:MAG: NTP transferase domain-containing protein, partial [Candidatus Korarchaeota archaeon]|nr:NTP transferase domain-containing protein [Candidatus Korarchaeota archaeon]
MKALVLAGGFGTRLRPLSCTRPKILFPIVNKPLLRWILERLSKNNIKEVILAVNLQTEVFLREYGVAEFGLRVSFSRDPIKQPLGT